MSVESRVKQEFERLAGEVQPRADGWRDVEARIRRERGVRIARSSLIAAAAVAIVFAALRLGTEQPVVLEPPPVGNGRLAFVRADPATVREGQVPATALYSVEPNGTGLRMLADGINYRSRPAWSRDGSMIAFARGDDILVANSDGSGTRTLVDCAFPTCSASHPVWLPNQTHIGFVRTEGPRVSIWVVRADGSGLADLGISFRQISDHSWSPDGRRVAVAGQRGEDGIHAIYIVRVVNGELLSTIEPPGIEIGETVAWSPDGEWLAFDAFGVEARTICRGKGIYLVRPDGSSVTPLTGLSSEAADCTDVYPAWSPDGNEIAFTRARAEFGSDGFIGDLLAIDVVSRQIRAVTSGPTLDCCPSWQPIPQ